MSNLLPRNVQKRVWAGTRSRIVGVVALGLIGAACVSALTLLPSYLVLAVAVPAAVSQAETAPSTATSTADIATAQGLLKTLNPVLLATTTPDVTITAVLAARPKGVHVSHVTYTAGSPASIMLVGTAQDRDAINTYRAVLMAAAIGTVSVPVSALIGSEDGQFTMTITGTF